MSFYIVTLRMNPVRLKTMKKQLIWIAAVALIAASGVLMHRGRGTSSYPYVAVDGALRDLSRTPGPLLVEMSSVGGALRGSRFPFVDRMVNQVSGRPLYNDVMEYVFTDGSDRVRASVFHSHGSVDSVKIHPDAGSSKLAASINAKLVANFPDLDCHIGSP